MLTLSPKRTSPRRLVSTVFGVLVAAIVLVSYFSFPAFVSLTGFPALSLGSTGLRTQDEGSKGDRSVAELVNAIEALGHNQSLVISHGDGHGASDILVPGFGKGSMHASLIQRPSISAGVGKALPEPAALKANKQSTKELSHPEPATFPKLGIERSLIAGLPNTGTNFAYLSFSNCRLPRTDWTFNTPLWDSDKGKLSKAGKHAPYFLHRNASEDQKKRLQDGRDSVLIMTKHPLHWM